MYRTGLYAESHGIVGNVRDTVLLGPDIVSSVTQNFWDPATGLEFQYNRAESAWISGWWFGEPVRHSI